MPTSTSVVRVALIGARGYTGAELVKLLAGHPYFELSLVTSRSAAGRDVRDVIPEAPAGLRFSDMEPTDVAHHPGIGVWVLALPNAASQPWVKAIDRHSPDALIVDLSADHRFDDSWAYGLPEARRKKLLRARRVANPGCYATAAQLALMPVVDLLEGAANVFGVSGYSGAGTTPSPKNDPEVLRDNLLPYALVGHTHELEIRWQLGHPVYFMPHVAPYFRGITATVSMRFKRPLSFDELKARYVERYAYEPLVEVTDAAPLVRDAAYRHGAAVGGFAVDATTSHAVVIATLDNLLKGAATQALQNMNLACGFDELAGIRPLLA
ncbi:MAG: N-acetyl-gamma-glutamyl-phosphate reductase [Deltaproteobacteria bacterium]|nr:MAG: N-acetyl-gamma-glutamyl-phosphate reductase [Deltaproteobacteria bacterium]